MQLSLKAHPLYLEKSPLMFILSIENSSRSVEGSGSTQLTPKLENKAFSDKPTQYIHVVLLRNTVQSVLVHSCGYSLQYCYSVAGLGCKFATSYSYPVTVTANISAFRVSLHNRSHNNVHYNIRIFSVCLSVCPVI
jgi:hypothetical protein